MPEDGLLFEEFRLYRLDASQIHCSFNPSTIAPLISLQHPSLSSKKSLPSISEILFADPKPLIRVSKSPYMFFFIPSPNKTSSSGTSSHSTTISVFSRLVSHNSHLYFPTFLTSNKYDSLYQQLLDHVCNQQLVINPPALVSFLKMLSTSSLSDLPKIETVNFNQIPVDFVPFSDMVERFFNLPTQFISSILINLLLEHQIIISSFCPSIVTRFVSFLTFVTTPFDWKHLFVPLLSPFNLELVNSPFPFIIGVTSGVLAKLSKTIDYVTCKRVILIDFDSGSIRSLNGDQGENLTPNFEGLTSGIKKIKKFKGDLIDESSVYKMNLLKQIFEEFFNNSVFVEQISDTCHDDVYTIPDSSFCFDYRKFCSISYFHSKFWHTQCFRCFLDDFLLTYDSKNKSKYVKFSNVRGIIRAISDRVKVSKTDFFDRSNHTVDDLIGDVSSDDVTGLKSPITIPDFSSFHDECRPHDYQSNLTDEQIDCKLPDVDFLDELFS
ncbi:hypothetical protein P9112_003282 [Eukaryota sp. TZLM1-RC]